MPPALLDAFRSTLEDSVAAHVLLHVIDVTDPLVHDKIHIVDEILDSIGAEQERILVLNKFDMLDNDTEEDISIRDEIQSMYPDRVCLPLSAVTGL